VYLHTAPGQTNRASADANPRPAHVARRDALRNDDAGRAHGNRETDSLRARDDRRVDADHFTARIDERLAGVSGLERGVGLNDGVDQPPGLRPHRAAERADDAGSDRRLEAERVSTVDDELAGLEAR